MRKVRNKACRFLDKAVLMQISCHISVDPMKIEPLRQVQQRRVGEQVYEQLIFQIRNKMWQAGEKLPSENELCKQLGVSRISIREAMQKLAALGVVETRQGEGSFVKEITSADYKNILMPVFMVNKTTLLETLEYRKIMEIGALELAMDRMDEQEMKYLEELVRRLEKNEKDITRFAKDDLDFHMTIAKATKNELIIHVTDFLYEVLAKSMEYIVENLGMRDGKYYHRLILEKIKVHDKEGAVQAMREHVERTIDRVVMLQNGGK